MTSVIFNALARPICGPFQRFHFAAWQRGITHGLGARNGQIVAILSYESTLGILTANATTPYYLP